MDVPLPSRRVLIALPILLVLYVAGIAQVGLISVDEPRYAEIGYEMAHDHQWVTPRLWGRPWFEKPALLYWMIGAAYGLGLNDDWAPRLPVALLSVAFLWFYYEVLKREFGEPAGFWAAGLCATCAGWLAYGRTAVTDLPLAVFFSAAVLLALHWVRSGERKRLPYAGACLGLAVLAKGLVPVVLVIPVLWVARRRWRDLWIPTASCLAVAAPWYILCSAANGRAFLVDFFLKHHLQRFSSAALEHVQPFWFYVPVLAGLLFPWTPLALLLRWRADDRQKALLGVAAFGFVFFSFSTNKLPGYLLPLLPSLFALIGKEMEPRRERVLLALSVGLLGLLPLVALLLPTALDTGLRQAMQDVSLTGVLLWPAIGIAAAIVYGLRRWPAAVPLSIAASAMIGFGLSVFQDLDRAASVRGDAPPACVSEWSPRRSQVYGFQFYRHAPLPACVEEK